MGFLTRLLAGLTAAAALGTGLSGTANAVDVTGATGNTKSVVKLTADDTNTLPDHLVNGDFEYLPDGGWKTVDAPSYMTNAYTSVDPNNGQYMRNAQHSDADLASWVDWPGFDQSKFAWKTDQKGGHDQGGLKDRAEAVELQQDSMDGNTYAEMVASETGRTIYQNLATIPGTLYKIRLKHASLCKDNVDQMQVVINGTPIEMTRVTSNGHGDKVGEKSTTIGTRVTNENRWHHFDQWETYEGYYIIPDGQTTTRFGFKAVNYLDPTKGNLLDDVTFARAYKLSYDKNASDANGKVPSNQRGKENTVQPAASKTDGNVKTVADDAAGRTVLECKHSGEGATGPYANKFCWIDWSNLPLNRTGEPIPVRINVPGGHIDADATVAHTDNAALTAQDFTGNKWSRLNPAYKLTGNTALAFHHIQGSSVDPLASVMFSNITPVANQTVTSVNVLKDFQLAFGDAETMSGYVVNDKKTYEQTDIESDKTLDKLGMIGDANPNQSYSEANTGYGTTHVTLAGGPAGKHAPFTDETNSKGAAVIGATQPTRFKVSFKQVNHPVNNAWSAIAIGVYMPYLTAYPLTYDKNAQDATGSIPSDETVGAVKQAKARATGSVRLAADKTASGLTVHDLEMNDIPADYRQFILNTTDTRLSQVEFEDGAWYKSTDSSSQGMWPLKAGASLTIPSVGDWTDPSGRTHQISMTMRLKDWNGGSVSELYRFDGHGNIVGDGRFWINTAYGSGYSSLPAKVEQAMGKVDTSKRVGCSWTVEFTYADTGEKVPDTFKGVTGFNDLDGWDAQSDLKFEGVQLLDGFDGAYKRSDAELGTYGTNGFAGIGHDAGDEAHLNAPQQSRHRLAATWTGSTFTFSYDLSNPAGRTDGSRMTFGAPVTRTAVLTYDKNAADASGQVPSNTTPDTTQTASSKSTGKVSDLVQRTTTHEDGSVTVRTVDTTTDVVSGCQVYYPAGQKITLATMAKDDDCWDSSMLSRPGHTQLGWNQDRNATQAQAQVTMVEGGMTVYAVWVGNPVLTYDTNKPATWSGQMPSTPASVSVAYNTAAADGSGWAAGDTSKIRGYKFLGWYTAPQDNTGLYQWATPLTGNVTVYAHWQRLQANVVYNANGGTGSHANTTGWQYSDVTIPGDTSKSFKRDKYVFKGWGTKPGKADVVYKDGSKVALQDKDITLYAQWQEVHENFVETGGIGLPIAIAGGVLLLMFGIGSTVMLTRRMNGHGMPDDE